MGTSLKCQLNCTAAAEDGGGDEADAEPAAHAAAALGLRDGGGLGGGGGGRGRRGRGEEGRRGGGGRAPGLRLPAAADGDQEEALLDLRVRHLSLSLGASIKDVRKKRKGGQLCKSFTKVDRIPALPAQFEDKR